MDPNSANFLLDRLRQQAQTEGNPLTPDEETFLELATSGRTQEANQVVQSIKKKESIQQFGQRLVNLLSNAYHQDLQTDPEAKTRYKSAMQSLMGGHSIFRFVLPLILERGINLQQDAETDMVVGRRVSVVGTVSPGTPTRESISEPVPPSIPGVEPESSVKRFLMLLFLVIAALVLWFIISRSR